MTTSLRRRLSSLAVAMCTFVAATRMGTGIAASTDITAGMDNAAIAAAEVDSATGVTGAGLAAAASSSVEDSDLVGLSDVPDPTPDALHISLTWITPDRIDGQSKNSVTVSGTLTNVGKLPISDIDVRLQRGDYAPYGNALRHTLTEDQINYPTTLPFHHLATTLNPGDSTSFTLTARIHGGDGDTLNINAPGVYPLLVNVNGRVSNSDSARLHDARVLLPVLSLPGSDRQDPATVASRPTTILWPLALTPQEASYYSFSSIAVLRNENLGISLGEHGRLRALLDAAGSLLKDHALNHSVCFAIDPDLLRTVDRMTRPYRVLNTPNNWHDGMHRGKHTKDAQSWIEDLRSLTANNCVIALPWSGASLATTTHLLPDKPHQLMEDSRRVTAYFLHKHLTSHVIWPNTGTLTPYDIPALDHSELLLSSTALTTHTDKGFGQLLRYDHARYTVTPYDSTLSTALAATGQNPVNTPYSPSDSRYVLTADSATARMQDATATLLWKTSAALRREKPAHNTYAGTPLLIAPPQQWSVTGDDLATFTSTLRYLAQHNLITAQSLTDALAQAHTKPIHGTFTTSSPLTESSMSAITQAISHIHHYRNLFTDKNDNNFYKRTRYNIYRAATTRTLGLAPTLVGNIPPSHNHQSDTKTRRHGDSDSANTSGITLRTPDDLAYPKAYARSITLAAHAIRSSVTLIKPGSIYTLASTDSGLVLVARNELPADVTVTVHTRERLTDGDKPANTTKDLTKPLRVTIPAQSSLNINIPVHLHSGKSVPVRVQLLSADQQELGTTVDMTVRVSHLTPLLGFLLTAAVVILAVLIVKRVLPLIRRGNGQGSTHE
jgi:possible glycoprotein